MRNHPNLRKGNSIKLRRTRSRFGLGGLVLALLFTLVGPALGSALNLAGTPFGAGRAVAAGTYNGTAFRDFNADGVQGAQEPGLSGVIVTLYDAAGAVAGTAVTDADGNYSISSTGTGPYRVEFTLPGDPAGTPGELVDFMRPGAAGGSTVQFVNDGGATVNVGFNNPGQYAPDSPLPIAIAEHSSGYRRFINNPPDIDPTVTTILETYGSNTTDRLTYNQPAKDVVADHDDTGGIWAMAYDRSNEVIYAGSFVRRFVPLKGNPTTIHRIDVSTGIVTDWITLDPARADPHGPTPTWTEDFDVINTVGREGIGGMKMSEDGSTLFAVDLGTRTLYSIPVNDDGSAGVPVAIDLVNGANSPYSLVANCAVEGDFRPFGLGIRDGILYLGAVCSAESTANNTGLPVSSLGGTRVGDPDALRGYVFAFDGATWTLPVDFPLTYERGIINRQGLNSPWARTNPMNNARWAPWVYTYPFIGFVNEERIAHYPQPILSEIEFDNNGDMILGLMDRFALMDAAEAVRPNNLGSTVEPTAAGDILRACVTTPGNWVLEKLISGDTSCDTAGELAHNVPPTDEPLVTIDEYYYTDQYHGFNDLGAIPGAADMPNHSEVAQGALAQIPGRDSVISTVQDPNFNATLSFYRSGLHWYNNSDGSFTRAYEVRDEQMRTLGFWAKAGGLGDVEPLVPPAPIEIGNRVWVDANFNGRQDPSEDGLANVVVELYREIPDVGLIKVAQTSTDAQGRYLFSFDGNPNSPTPEDWSFGNDRAVLPNQRYEVRISLTQPAIAAPRYIVTTQDSAAGGSDSSNNFNTDLRDNDGDNGLLNTNQSTIVYSTGRAGENNHTLDFGLRTPPPSFDWGDLPDGVAGSADYPTLEANNGPLHFIDGFTYMGAGVDDENDGQPNAAATGDDIADTPDDEDGVTFGLPMTPGATVPVTITTETQAGTGALSLFIDFNADGDFDDNGEVILSDEVVNDGVQVIPVSVPADAAGVFGVRARFTNGPQQGGGKPTGGAETGEVEDYILAALGDYVWFDDNKDGIQNEPLTNGANGITVELLGSQNNVLATTVTKNDANGNPGYYQFPGLIPGTPYSVRFTPPTGYGFTTQSGTIDISNNSDANPATGATVSITLQPGEHNPNIDAGLVLLTYDRGDLPDGVAGSADYATLLANGGPSHLIDDVTFLGAGVDDENDGQPNATATGDDVAGTPDDEDGVTFGAPMIPGATTTVTITTNSADGDGALSLFIDFNGDGDFADAGEEILSDEIVSDGAQVITVTVPTDATGIFGVRARFTDEVGQGGAIPTGNAANGEVEDYILSSLGDYVWVDDNKDGIQNEPAANGRNGVIVQLLGSQNNVLATTTTRNDANGNPGYYEFPGLIPGTPYSVRFTPPANFVFTTQSGNVNDANNSDADPNSGVTASVTLTPGQKNPNVDAGLIQILFDWGDLPDASGVVNPNGPEYNTDSTGATGPSHVIIDTLRMGAAEDAEDDGQPSATATGDDINGTPDDEDAVTLPVFLVGNSAVVPVTVTNSTGAAATLYGFIDFNGDGDFADAGEAVTATVASGVNGIVNLTFNVPLDANTTDELGARFRLSTDAGLGPDGPASDGEIEDYLITIDLFDLALRKQLATGQPSVVQPGDDVTFTLTIFNQGSVDAFDIEVTDYLDANLTLSPNDNNGWVAGGNIVTNTIASLGAGQQTTLNIVMRVSAGFLGGELTNWAEISKGDKDRNPGNTPPTDKDSTPDKSNQNTPGEKLPPGKDDEVDEDGKKGGDEDDHDPAKVTVIRFDWGDLPDASGVVNPNGPEYNTDSSGATGPSHVITDTLRMGAVIDAERNGQPSATATGDDVNGTPDDEDAVTLPVFLVGNSAVVPVTVTNSTGAAATLYGFIDFNGDGDFADAGEAVTATVASGVNGIINLTFNVPLDANTTDELGARFRLSTDAGLGPDGPARDGEIEDYLITIDLFDLALRKQLAAGQPSVVQPGDDVTFTLTIFNQGSVDAFDIEVTDYLDANLTLSPNDKNGWVAGGNIVTNTIASLGAGQQTTLNIVMRVSVGFLGGELTNWAEISKGDKDRNPGNTPPTDKDSTPDKSNQNTPGEKLPPGKDDEVDEDGKKGGDEDDHDPAKVTVRLLTYDRGDLPDGIVGAADYPTLLANGGPSHLIDATTFLGAGVDSESNGQPNATATGDDVAGTPDDEDGVTFGAPLIPGTTVAVTITTNTADNDGALSLFIDFNGDGDFADSGEVIRSDSVVTDGVQVVSVNVPAGATGIFGVRVRFTDEAGQGGNIPTGNAANGEVEDYILSSLGDYVWVDEDEDGTQNEPAANGRNGVTVQLLNSQGTVIATTTTKNDANGNPGYYEFPGLIPGTPYSVRFTPPAGFTFTTQTGNVNDAGNSDADPISGVTSSVSLIPGEKNPNVDAGLVLPPPPPPPTFFDWGDLPDASGVVNPNGPEYNTDSDGVVGPSHEITDTLRMGAVIDDENDGQPSATATGDDATGTPDDEDAVTLPSFLAGRAANVAVSVTNSTGKAATLYGFIDFNGDGTFDDAGETATAAVNNGANGIVNLTFNVPLDANTTAQLGARFRLSTAAGLGPNGPAGDGEVEDYLIRVDVFDLALRKQLATGQPVSVEAGDDVTFTLTIFNQGTVDAYNIEVTDYLTTNLSLSPNDTNNWTVDGVNVVKPIAFVAAQQQATVNIVLRVAADFRGDELVNWAEISKGDDDTNPNNTPPTDVDSTPDKTNQNTPGERPNTFVDDEVNQNGKGGGDEDDHDPAKITVDQLPSVLVTKVLETPNPVKLGSEITFSIRITNTGPTTIVTLPLSDTYEAEFISFVRSIPTHDRAVTGEVEWFDLTTVFGDLVPGASVEVKVVFTADKPTTTTINVATVVNALDEDKKPSGSGSSTGVIIQDPTVVELLSFTATGVDANTMQVSWVTGLEIDTWGFNIWRSESGNRADAVKVTTQLVPAQGSANSGGSYSILDSGVRPGVLYTYWLAETQTNGIVIDYGPVTGITGDQPLNSQRIFLPVVGR